MAVANLYNCKEGVPERLQFDLHLPDHSGGEGNIYFSKDGQYAVKIYHQQKAGSVKRRLLESNMLLGASLTEEEAQFLCLPVAIVRAVDSNDRVGSVTRRIPTPPYRKLLDLVYTPRQAFEQFQTGRSWANYLQISRGVARAVAVLNGKGCAPCDLHFRNFLINPQDSGTVLIDLDGLVVPVFLPPQVKGLIGFMALEVMSSESAPSELSDRHSLAVLVLHTLLFRNVLTPLVCYDPEDRDNDDIIGWGREAVFSEHQSDQRNRPSWLGVPMFEGGRLSYRMLTPALQKLTERALVDGLHSPDKRPSAQEWVNALGWVFDGLWRCSQCRLHFPYQYWIKPVQRRQCPFCGKRFASPLPSVIRLYAPRNRGNYGFTGRYLVLGNGSKLFADVLEPHRNPPMSRKTEPSVGHVEWDARNEINRLVNDEDTVWRSQSKGGGSVLMVGKGDSVPLQPGVLLYFGEGRRLLLATE